MSVSGFHLNTFRDMECSSFFGMYPAMGIALYRRGVMDNLAR